MASSDTTAVLNHSESPHACNSPSRKRPLNGLTSLDSSQHHANGFITLQSNDRETVDTSSSATPETGRRKRKKTRAFEIPGPTSVRKINTGALGVNGRGVKLSTIPNIAYAMDKRHAKAPEIEFLHRLLFNSAGTVFKRKSNIRAFSGFVFQSEKERARVRDKLARSHLNLLKRVTVLLDVHVAVRKNSKPDERKSQHHNTEIEMAAEAFLGSDSVASEDLNNDMNDREEVEDQRPAEKVRGISEALSRITNGKLTDHVSDSKPNSVTAIGKEGGAASDEAKSERYLSRQRKEEAARISKEETVQAILSFLEMPKIPPGRVNIAQREKEKKRQKKAMEKAKAQKALMKKAEEKRKQLLEAAKKKARESDEDGDEDLELEAKPWIVLARERLERDQQAIDDSGMSASGMTNGHR